MNNWIWLFHSTISLCINCIVLLNSTYCLLFHKNINIINTDHCLLQTWSVYSMYWHETSSLSWTERVRNINLKNVCMCVWGWGGGLNMRDDRLRIECHTENDSEAELVGEGGQERRWRSWHLESQHVDDTQTVDHNINRLGREGGGTLGTVHCSLTAQLQCDVWYTAYRTL